MKWTPDGKLIYLIYEKHLGREMTLWKHRDIFVHSRESLKEEAIQRDKSNV